MKKLLLAAILIFQSAVCIAAGDQYIHIFAFSDNSCGTWAKTADHLPTRAAVLFWMRGVLTGYNINAKQQIPYSALSNNETLTMYIDKQCREDPLTTLPTIAFRLIHDLGGEKIIKF